MSGPFYEIQMRRGMAALWTSTNPVLFEGELGVELDTGRFKIGNGLSTWNTLGYQTTYLANGTKVAPNAITAVGGVGVLGVLRELQFVKSDGGAVTVSANPRIAAGTILGQELVVMGTSDTDTLEILNGQGVDQNGPVLLVAGSVISYIWDGTAWREVARNGTV